MVTELLRYPFGTAPAAERPDGSGNGLPDLTAVGFIAALHGRCEQGVGFEGADAQVVYRLPHLSLLGNTSPCCLASPLDRFLCRQPPSREGDFWSHDSCDSSWLATVSRHRPPGRGCRGDTPGGADTGRRASIPSAPTCQRIRWFTSGGGPACR